VGEGKGREGALQQTARRKLTSRSATIPLRINEVQELFHGAPLQARMVTACDGACRSIREVARMRRSLVGFVFNAFSAHGATGMRRSDKGADMRVWTFDPQRGWLLLADLGAAGA
jgi:hypothetical protein